MHSSILPPSSFGYIILSTASHDSYSYIVLISCLATRSIKADNIFHQSEIVRYTIYL